MKKLFTLFIGILIAFSMNAQDLSLNEILENYYEVCGMDELAGLESVIMEGKTSNQGMENTFTITILNPGRYRLDVPIQGQNMVQAFNHGSAWMVAPWTGSLDPKDLSDDEIKRMEKQADLTGDLYNWKEKGNKLELLGKEDFEGSDVYKIKCVDKNEDVTTYFMDAENFVILKEESTVTMRGEEMKTQSTLSDYKEVGNMVLPHSVSTSYQGQVVSQIMITEYVLNPQVDVSIFEKPATGSVAGEEK